MNQPRSTMKPDAIDSLARELAGAPLTIVHAEAEHIARAASGEPGASIPLLPPFHVSEGDASLVRPEDIASELGAMFADGDTDLLAEAMRDGLVVIGVVEKEGRGKVSLHIDACCVPEKLLARMPYAHTVRVGRGANPVAEINALDEAQVTVASEMLDDVGLEKILRGAASKSGEFAGASWQPPKNRKDLAGVDPTYAWSKRLGDGVGIEAVLFSEYEEMVMLLRTARLVPADGVLDAADDEDPIPAPPQRPRGLYAVP